eukprot:42435_1
MFILFIKTQLDYDHHTELAHSDKLPTLSSSEIKWYCKTSNWIKILLLLILLTFLILIFIHGHYVFQIGTEFLDWMKKDLFIGSLAFIAVYIGCNLFMIPGFLLTIGAGFTFVNAFEQHSWSGIFCAIFIVSSSRILGATLAFLNGRYLIQYCSIRSWLLKYDKFWIMNEIVKAESFKVCFLLRLSPICPYGFLNYAMAVATDVKLKPFFYGNFAMIPDSITYCLVGASVASISELSSVGVSSNVTLLIVSGIMTVISLIGVIYVGCVAKRELTRLSRIVENDMRKNDNVKHSDIDSMDFRDLTVEINMT